MNTVYLASHGHAIHSFRGPAIQSRPSFARRYCLVTRSNADVGAQASTASVNASTPQLVQLTIKKPLGLVLAESEGTKEVFVEEVVAGGNAAKTGQVQVGDVIERTSATVLKSGKEGEFEREGYGKRVYDNWETVDFDCAGQDFATVMAAIASNNERWGIKTVKLTLRRS